MFLLKWSKTKPVPKAYNRQGKRPDVKSYLVNNIMYNNPSVIQTDNVVEEFVEQSQNRKVVSSMKSAPHLKDVDNIVYETSIEDVETLNRKVFWSNFAFVLQYGTSLVLSGAIIFSIVMMFRAQGGRGQMFRDTATKLYDENNAPPKVTFDMVAGLDSAKGEVVEIVDFLKKPEKYSKLGASIPKGILLVGPPGTGKTLLASAIAGEAGVPFFSCSAASIVEVFVGLGAKKIRELFEKAKKSAPCIIFFDEIDAIGRVRSNGMNISGGNDEREQTLNQLLTEMNGFEPNSGVIVVAATNRADVLDKALLRPGRFDRQVNVTLPDKNGRMEIMSVHTKNKPIDDGVNFDAVARVTAGFSGADLMNLSNEAAIYAARAGRDTITQNDFDSALEKITIGLEKNGAVVSKKKRRVVAYHEAGHALCAVVLDDFDEIKKVTVSPRGQAGGVTQFLPSSERLDSGLYTREYLEPKNSNFEPESSLGL